jgi:23S rRNA pseudouridine1911/1915/1917 synthase
LELRFEVPPDRDGWRLDRFLCDQIPRLSRTRVHRIIREEALWPGGCSLKPSRRVRRGEVVVLHRQPRPEPEAPQEFAIIHQDDDLLILDKPAGLPVHPSARYHLNTLTTLLRRRYGEARPRITHRLDRETSGLLVCAWTKEAERAVKVQFQERVVHKEYLAIVQGRPPFTELVLDQPLGPALNSEVRVRMGPRDDELGQTASTKFRVVQRWATGALVAAEPLTGRQHQIRAHLAELGYPVVGDKIYGVDERLFIDFVESDGMLSDEDWDRLELYRHALHAHRVTFRHPRSGKEVQFSCPLPSDLAQYVAQVSHDASELRGEEPGGGSSRRTCG